MSWIADDGLIPPVAEGPLPVANCSGDILVQWDNTQALGDWQLAAGDLQTGQDLETACLVSLFTDALAAPDFVPTDGTSDRRGWWGDPYQAKQLGSNIWQLERSKKRRDTLGQARRFALSALQWLVDDGVAASIACNTAWVTPTMLGIAVAITKPGGSETQFMFAWAWQGLATLQSPISFTPPPTLALTRARRLLRG